MKKLAVMLSLTAMLGACSTTQPVASKQDVAPVYTNPVVANTQSAVMQAPEWMTKLPKSANAVYENGTATSSDFGMADLKAKTMAYTKICTAAGGKIRSQMKMYKSDTGEASTESTELAVRSLCPDVDLTGIETVEMKHVAEGTRIRTYVLVALPTGAANVLKTNKDNVRRAPDAFKELDEITTGKVSAVGEPKVVATGLPHETISDPVVKSKVEAAIERGNALIVSDTVR